MYFVPLFFLTVPETESQPSQDYVDSLQQLKDMLSELECKQQSIASGLSEPSKVEKALQQAKVRLSFALKRGSCLFSYRHPPFSCLVFSGVTKMLLRGKSIRECCVEAASGGCLLKAGSPQAAEGCVRVRVGYFQACRLHSFSCCLCQEMRPRELGLLSWGKRRL